MASEAASSTTAATVEPKSTTEIKQSWADVVDEEVPEISDEKSSSALPNLDNLSIGDSKRPNQTFFVILFAFTLVTRVSFKDELKIVQVFRIVSYIISSRIISSHKSSRIAYRISYRVYLVSRISYGDGRFFSIWLCELSVRTEEVETELKEASFLISMGTEITDLDLMNIKDLCSQVLSFAEYIYRAQLYDYLKSRLNIIAPNFTALAGELVGGARLISHGGSLLNLAKQPGNTVQILGAEKALFRALKTKHARNSQIWTYLSTMHPLIGQAVPKHKGKISTSAKTALAIRCDALGDSLDNNTMGLEN